MIVRELSVVEFLVHVGVWYLSIEEVNENEVRDVDDDEQFQNGIPLL